MEDDDQLDNFVHYANSSKKKKKLYGHNSNYSNRTLNNGLLVISWIASYKLQKYERFKKVKHLLD